MVYYYRFHRKILFSFEKIESLQEVNEKDIHEQHKKYIYYICQKDWKTANPLETLIHPDQVKENKEGIHILRKQTGGEDGLQRFPGWIQEKIKRREVGICNFYYPRWKSRLEWQQPEKWKINIVGLGNVGGILLTALRLLGGNKITEIGIYDTNEKVVSRWEQEVNQILDGSDKNIYPPVRIKQPEDLFQADLVVFCISIGVPSPETKIDDVRMMQLEANSRIIRYYAQRARKKQFDGIFAVVSDPVDLLCQNAFLASNYNSEGNFDGKGLSSDQIRGFGLGVMHGRAAYYAQKNEQLKTYQKQGRVFGPHGKGLVVVNDIQEYNSELSASLTKDVLMANLKIRETGFKPYIAPAISSGALSLLSLIKGQWHYSSAFLGGIYWGVRNRQTPVGIEWEQYRMTDEMFRILEESYHELKRLSE